MASDDLGLPIVRHDAIPGVDCDGCLLVQMREKLADIVCNRCGAVVRTVPAENAAAVLGELASGGICSVRCPRCGAMNTFPGFSSIDVCFCLECGQRVAAGGTVQKVS
jgi:hypothetical protein